MSAKLKVSFSDGKAVKKSMLTPIDSATGNGLARDAARPMATGLKSVPSPFFKARAKAWLAECRKAMPGCAEGWELVEEKSRETLDTVQLVVENPAGRVPELTFNEELGEPVLTYKTEQASFLIKKIVPANPYAIGRI